MKYLSSFQRKFMLKVIIDTTPCAAETVHVPTKGCAIVFLCRYLLTGAFKKKKLPVNIGIGWCIQKKTLASLGAIALFLNLQFG